MSNELIDEQDRQENGPYEQQQEGKGNILSRIGKIFLVASIVAAQAIAAFAVVKNNYSDIRSVVESFNTTGGYYYQLENIIINPANSTGNHYLLLSVAFEVDSQTDLSVMEKMEVEVMDRINFHMMQKSTAELGSRELRENIKKELIDEVELIFNGNMVRNLYFTKYVIQ